MTSEEPPGSWRVAGRADPDACIRALALRRPIFHSEADMQLEFGWQLRLEDPLARVRLETRPRPGVHLDVLVDRPDLGRATAIELKYLTARYDIELDGETFSLAHHGAQDIRGYDVMRDIERVEQLVDAGVVQDGLVIVISNDKSYWTDPAHGRSTGAAAFRLYQGTEIGGTRAWREGSKTGTGERARPLALRSRYLLHWSDYCKHAGSNGLFRVLIVRVLPHQGSG